jgi:hypothetical protein
MLAPCGALDQRQLYRRASRRSVQLKAETGAGYGKAAEVVPTIIRFT